MRLGVVFVLMVLGACAEHDLGAPCHLLKADNNEARALPAHTFIQSGSGECSEFICASFNGAPPVCSRPCESEGDACEGDFVCTRALLSPELLELLRRRTESRDDNANGVDDFEEIASGLPDSLFCAPSEG